MDWPLLAGLSEDDRREILQRMGRRRYRRGEVVFHEGDPGDGLHMIAQGKLMARASTPLGDEAALSIMGPGEVFGEMILFDRDARRSASIIAIEHAETRVLLMHDVERLRRTHPAIDRFLIDVLAERVRNLTTKLLEALHVSADIRVMRTVLYLDGIYGDAVPIPFRQDDIAAMAGTTRSTANRRLKWAERAGILRLGRGRVTVVDRAGLELVAR